MKALTQSEKEIARKFKRGLRARSLGKLYYDEADIIFTAILKEVSDPTKPFRLVRSGKKFGRFKDNYPAGTNVAFRSHGIKRFEPEVIEKP